MPLLSSRIKSERELQTVREMVGGKNNVWGRHSHLAWPDAAGHPARDGATLLSLLRLRRNGAAILLLSSWRSWRHTGSRRFTSTAIRRPDSVSFITTAGTEGDFIDLKGMKKVEDFRSRWLFVDSIEESELFHPSSSPLGPARHSLKRP
jgi:hypothetical protein